MMVAEIVSLNEWRQTRNSKAATVLWARRIQKQLTAQAETDVTTQSAMERN
jgi:hypothetical protein